MFTSVSRSPSQALSSTPARWVLASLVVASISACNPELETGSYDISLAGSSTTLAGVESAMQEEATFSVTLVSTRGPDQYLFNVCDGPIDFQSSTPCFDDMAVRESSEGLVGGEEIYFDWDVDGVYCYGTETLTLGGEILDEVSAEISLEYVLRLDGDTGDVCANSMTDQIAHFSLTGTLTQ